MDSFLTRHLSRWRVGQSCTHDVETATYSLRTFLQILEREFDEAEGAPEADRSRPECRARKRAERFVLSSGEKRWNECIERASSAGVNAA